MNIQLAQSAPPGEKEEIWRFAIQMYQRFLAYTAEREAD